MYADTVMKGGRRKEETWEREIMIEHRFKNFHTKQFSHYIDYRYSLHTYNLSFALEPFILIDR